MEKKIDSTDVNNQYKLLASSSYSFDFICDRKYFRACFLDLVSFQSKFIRTNNDEKTKKGK